MQCMYRKLDEYNEVTDFSESIVVVEVEVVDVKDNNFCRIISFV